MQINRHPTYPLRSNIIRVFALRCVCACLRASAHWWARALSSGTLAYPNGLERKSMLCFPQIHANIHKSINEIAINSIWAKNAAAMATGSGKRNSAPFHRFYVYTFDAIKGKMLTDALRTLRARCWWWWWRPTTTTLSRIHRVVNVLVSLMQATTQFHFIQIFMHVWPWLSGAYHRTQNPCSWFGIHLFVWVRTDELSNEGKHKIANERNQMKYE